MSNDLPAPSPHRRRPRYSGKYPRHFNEKYKELSPERYADTVAKVSASGKTPAGTHRPIMAAEVLQCLAPRPGETAVDCTLGYGGHTKELLASINPGGRVIALDVDPIELPKTEARLRAAGFDSEVLTVERSNFAGLPKVLARLEVAGVDMVLADLGVSSMQLDDPARGFSIKFEGPLDLRMNPERGQTAGALLEKTSPPDLEVMLRAYADEPHAAAIAAVLAGRRWASTTAVSAAIRTVLAHATRDAQMLSARRVFQALRIAVNDELSALESFLRVLPGCLNSGGRVAILTFHSGEDRRVKHAFESGLRQGEYESIAEDVVRASAEERATNPRSTSAKLRWARKSTIVSKLSD